MPVNPITESADITMVLLSSLWLAAVPNHDQDNRKATLFGSMPMMWPASCGRRLGGWTFCVRLSWLQFYGPLEFFVLEMCWFLLAEEISPS